MARILIADDDERVRWTLTHMLNEHELVLTESWPELLKMLDEERFDLVITDIVMPGYKDLAKESISSMFSERNQPVIFVSGYSEQALKVLPEDQKFITKPFSSNVMKVFVRKLLAAGEPHEDQP